MAANAKVRRICIWGTSIKKIADEAQLLAIARHLQHQFPDAKLTMISRYGQRITDTLAANGITCQTVRVTRVPQVVAAIARSDGLIIDGGPFYETAFQTLQCVFMVLMAKICRRTVFAHAVSVFPFKTWWGRWVYRRVFNGLDAISVRERVGLDILADLGVRTPVTLTTDPRFTLEPAAAVEVDRVLAGEGVAAGEPLFALTTRYLHPDVPAWVKRSHGYDDRHVLRSNQALARLADDLSEQGKLVLIPMHPELAEDQATADAIHRHMKHPERLRVLGRRYSPQVVIGIIARARLLVAGRLGSALFGTVTGTPVIGIAYESRMTDHLDRFGLGRYVFDWKDLDPDLLLERTRELLARDMGQYRAELARIRQAATVDAGFLQQSLRQAA